MRELHQIPFGIYTAFAIITQNNPKQLEKHCITKGQYLSILGVNFLMPQGDYGGHRSTTSKPTKDVQQFLCSFSHKGLHQMIRGHWIVI